MRAIINLVRLQFKLYTDENFSMKVLKKKVWIYVPIFLCILTMAALLIVAIVQLARFFVDAELTFEFICLLFLVVQAVQFVLGITNVANTLFGSENEDLLKLPVTGLQIFSAKAIYLYIHELMFSTAIILPALLAIAIFTGQAPAFYLMILPVCFVFPIIPFCLAIMFSIPATILRKIFNNKFILTLLGSLVAISFGYFVYISALEFMLNLIFFNTAAFELSPEIIATITNISAYLIPQKLIANFLFLQDVGLSFVIIVFATFITMVATLTVANKWYYQAFFKENDDQRKSRKEKSRLAPGGPFFQLANREFINIYRSISYSFQFFALSASSPLMVFFCTKMAAEIGVSSIGELILPGLILLVVVMFSALSSSFAASSITREGNKIYHMKIIPSKMRVQIGAKLFVYSIISIISVSLSCFVVFAAGYVEPLVFLFIYPSCLMIAVGSICNSIRRDIVNPAFADLGMGEMTVTNNNTIVTIAIGILISIAVGGTVVGLCYSEMQDIGYYTMIGFALVFVVFSVLRLFFRIQKTFTKIEP